MFRLFCSGFMVFPFLGLWIEGAIGLTTFLVIAAVIGIVCSIQSATRSNRTPIYEIVGRAVLTAYIPWMVIWFGILERVMGFWEATWLCFFGAYILLGVGYVIVTLGCSAVGATQMAKAEGYHPYWDTLPPIWNPHSVYGLGNGQAQVPQSQPQAYQPQPQTYQPQPEPQPKVPPGYAPVTVPRRK